MKYIITESQYNKMIDKFITYQFEPHEEITSERYPNSIFWIKDGLVIVEIERPTFFWVDEPIWNNISDMFSSENDEPKSAIENWLEEHYNLGGLLPTKMKWNHNIAL